MQTSPSPATPLCRLWVARRRGAIRTLTVTWPGHPHQPSEYCIQGLGLLVASLVATLADSLQHLRQDFTCYAPWSDSFVPLGGGAYITGSGGSGLAGAPGSGGGGGGGSIATGLRELVILDCHLPSAPAALGLLGGTLTHLAITMCQGFAEVQGEWAQVGC